MIGSATARKTQHVIKGFNGGWVVRKGGASRATKIHETLESAIKHGRKIAKNQNIDFYIHGSDGRVLEKNSYSTDVIRQKNQGYDEW